MKFEVAMVVFADKNYYNILGLEASASFREVDEAFKIFVKTTPLENFHTEASKLILEAHEVLSNQAKRKEYDCFLSTHPRDSVQFMKDSILSKKQIDDITIRAVAAGLMFVEYLPTQERVELRKIHDKFLKDNDHFQKEKYSEKTLKNLVSLFSDIHLSHLNEEARNNPAIIDASLFHSFSGLTYATKDLVIQLLKDPSSQLSLRMKNSKDPSSIGSEFLTYYRHPMDKFLFVKLMLINPTVIKNLPKEQILEFLKTPECRQHKDKISIHLLNEFYVGSGKPCLSTPTDLDLEILSEIVQNYNKNCLTDYFLNNPSQRSFKVLVKKLFLKYSDVISFEEMLPYSDFIDQESLEFTYNEEQETLTCSGKLYPIDNVENCTFSQTKKILADSAYRNHKGANKFLPVLAAKLKPSVFCKVLASIPPEKRVHYLFLEAKNSSRYLSSAYEAYCQNVEYDNFLVDDDFEERFQERNYHPQNQEHFNALEKLIYPTKPLDADSLINMKQEVSNLLKKYCSRWKLSIFGHHHEKRAQSMLRAIEQANSLMQVGLIIEKQLDLMQNRKTNYDDFVSKVLGRFIRSDKKVRWHYYIPKHLSILKNKHGSGYYHALNSAMNVILKYNETEISTLQANHLSSKADKPINDLPLNPLNIKRFFDKTILLIKKDFDKEVREFVQYKGVEPQNMDKKAYVNYKISVENLRILSEKMITLNTLKNCKTNRLKQLLEIGSQIKQMVVPGCSSVEGTLKTMLKQIPDPVNLGVFKSQGSRLKKDLTSVVNQLHHTEENVEAWINTIETIFSTQAEVKEETFLAHPNSA